MLTFAVTAFAFFFAVLIMSSGLILAGRRLRGSCGGVGGSACSCGPEKRAKCHAKGAPEERPPIPASALLAREANLPSNLVPRGLDSRD